MIDNFLVQTDFGREIPLTYRQRRLIWFAINLPIYKTEDRLQNILEMAARPQGTTVEEVAIHFEGGFQNRYNPAISALEEGGKIISDGTRFTLSGKAAKVYYTTGAR